MRPRGDEPGSTRRFHGTLALGVLLTSAALLAGCAENADLRALRSEFQRARLEALAAAAREAAVSAAEGEVPPLLGMRAGVARGLGVRFFDADGDRGCVSFWKDVESPEDAVAATSALAARDPRHGDVALEEFPGLRVEANVYGEFRRIASWREARAGIDTLMVVAMDDPTLIQVGVALDELWSAREYAMAVLGKAGLDPDRVDDGSLEWRAAPTLRFVLDPATPPQEPGSTANEKK